MMKPDIDVFAVMSFLLRVVQTFIGHNVIVAMFYCSIK